MIWKIGKGSLDLGQVQLMGIVNVTPDSFSDGGRCFAPDDAVEHALRLQEEGADILDMGGQSTRPGSERLTAEEEWARLSPVLARLQGRLRIPLSVDTFYPQVAQKAIALGAQIINDVSPSFNPHMASLVAQTGVGWVLTETGGDYPPEIVTEVARRLKQRAEQAQAAGVKKECLCLDPGFGFQKDIPQNLALLQGLEVIADLGYPLLVGLSRKRVIGALTGESDPARRDPGSVAAHLTCLRRGAHILRVHHIPLHRQAVTMWETERK